MPAEHAARTFAAMREHPAGVDSRVIGEVIAGPRRRVTLRTAFCCERVVDMLVG